MGQSFPLTSWQCPGYGWPSWTAVSYLECRCLHLHFFLPDSQRVFVFSSHHPQWFYRKNKYYPALLNSINFMYYKSCSQAHSPPPRLDLEPDSHFTTNSHSFTTELRFDGFKDTTCRTAFQACWHANDCWFYWCLQQLSTDYLQGFSAGVQFPEQLLTCCLAVLWEPALWIEDNEVRKKRLKGFISIRQVMNQSHLQILPPSVL